MCNMNVVYLVSMKIECKTITSKFNLVLNDTPKWMIKLNKIL